LGRACSGVSSPSSRIGVGDLLLVADLAVTAAADQEGRQAGAPPK
jgi:hypothetical protein